MTNKKTGLDERALASKVDSAIKDAEKHQVQFISGKPLPEDYENPKIGTVGHKCTDPDGKYRPDWMQLMIHRTSEDVPERQFFACGKRGTWRVQTGRWVDVPPEIISILENTIIEEVEMDMRRADPLSEGSVQRVVNRIPRFSTSMLPSG